MDILNLLCMAAMTVSKMAAQKGRFSCILAAKVTNQMSIFIFWHAESKYVNTNMPMDSRALLLDASASRAHWPVDIARWSKATAHWEFPIVESPPLVSMGCPMFAPKITPSRGPIPKHHCLPDSWTRLTYHAKWHLDLIRYFSTASWTVRQTHRRTEIFRFFKMAAVHHLGFQIVVLLIVIGVGNVHTRQYAKFGRSRPNGCGDIAI